jgi:sialic acid synthase SpsE
MHNPNITLIAEIGENYLGKISLAKKLIENAKKSGADYAKFQSYNENCLKKTDPEYNWFKKVSLKDNEHFQLKNYCKKKRINFLSSPFSLERAEFLCEKLKLDEIKVASSKMTNRRLLKYLNKKTKKVFLSTGMSNIREINQSLRYLDNTEVVIMHCVSEYPLKPVNSNLLAIQKLKKEFPKFTIGYSDHSIGNLAVEVAVSLGATVIEKHFTMNKNYKGTDHILSADFKDLKKLRKNINIISLMLGKEIKKPSKKEIKIRNFMRGRFGD